MRNTDALPHGGTGGIYFCKRIPYLPQAGQFRHGTKEGNIKMDAHKTGPKGLKRPRLTPLDRLQIEAGLQNGESPCSIARRTGHDLKTVLREIRDRARTIKTGVACRPSNKCVHRADCRKKHVCPKCLHRRERLCRYCSQCNSHCADYREDVCAKLQKSPHVCNGCPAIGKCVLTRRTYDGAAAQKDCERLLSESRKGANLTEEEVASFDDLTQEDVNLPISHINSYPRKALKDKAPCDLFTARVGAEDVSEKVFGIRKVSPNDVVLKPSLLGIEVKIKEWVLGEDSGK